MAVADGWAFEIDRLIVVGRLRYAVGDGVRWAVMKLSWGGKERGGIGRWVVVSEQAASLCVSMPFESRRVRKLTFSI